MTDFPDMKFSIERVSVVAKSRQLKASYTIEWPSDEWLRGPDLRSPHLYYRDTFNWQDFHRASRRERLKMLGQSE